MARVWAGVVVEENNLQVHITGGSGQEHQYLEQTAAARRGEALRRASTRHYRRGGRGP
jgi:hypothetical protein